MSPNTTPRAASAVPARALPWRSFSACSDIRRVYKSPIIANLSEHPESGQAAVLRRQLTAALREGELDSAADILLRLKEAEDPLTLETRGLELEYLTRRGAVAEAEVLSDQLLSQFPDSARIHYLAGQLAYRERAYAAAADRLVESLRIHDHWKTRRLLGKALTQLGRLDEAESWLAPLVGEHPECGLDLAWVEERKGDDLAALRLVEKHLEAHPDDAYALSKRRALRARALPAVELVNEVDDMRGLGLEVTPDLVPAYVEALLVTGQGEKVRELLKAELPAWDGALAQKVGWVCHRHHAPELATDLFLAALGTHVANPKLLTALEDAAAQCGRLPELIAVYERGDHASLDGRLGMLKRRLEVGAP